MTTKDIVLAILKRSKDYVSGEKISKKLNISRAAVNTAVKTLREEGYIILSSTNRGYLLDYSPDRLNEGELLALLPEDRVKNMIFLDTVDSTNTYLKQLAQQPVADGLIVVSNEQTNGRGRLGRGFQSSPDKGIYLSMIMNLDISLAKITNITAWVAVAVNNAIEKIYGMRPGIKWVNDLVLNKKKICGVLTEMSIEGESGHIQNIITGIGINVNYKESDFNEEIRQMASSLAIETGKLINRSQLVAEIVKNLDKIKNDWPHKKSEYLLAYGKDCINLNKNVRIVRNGYEERGIAENINDDFSLTIRFEDGHIERVSSGEVSVRGYNGYL